MALNIATKIEKNSKARALSKEFMLKHHITVNEPTQTHFSVEGVQTYSRQQIQAIKIREDKLMTAAQKEGTYVKPQCYQISDQIQFQIPGPSNIQSSSIKAKTKKTLQSAKPMEVARPQTAHKIVKPSIKNQVGRANQKLIKLDKEQAKKEKLQQKLEELSKHYKRHFGEDLKPTKKPIKDNSQQEQQKLSKRQIVNNDEDVLEIQESVGDQCLPQVKKKPGKSLATATRVQEIGNDDSFEQIQWQKASQPSKSRLNASTYSQKLCNAVNLLFD